jgi:EAL domain-containing protein (putative c-di-GMP-specific phosphodiesterase class I)
MDAIKIDRSFVASILTRQRTMAIVETIVKLAQALDLTVVAEGVEEPAQLEALRRTGCGCVQGYLLGRPMSVEDAERALQRQADACAVRVH